MKEEILIAIERVLVDNNRPMSAHEIFLELSKNKMEFRQKFNRERIVKSLSGAKLAFIRLPGAGYWPSDLACPKKNYFGCPPAMSPRDYYLHQFGNRTPKSEKLHTRAVGPLLARAPSAWVRVRGKVIALQLALRKAAPRWRRTTHMPLELTVPGPNGSEVLEQWTFVSSDYALSFIEQLMQQQGRPLKFDEILEVMIESKLGLQTFAQRWLLESIMKRHRWAGRFVYVLGEGYWPANISQ